MEKAKAAVFVGANKPFEVREFDVVNAPKGYARCELIASGVCGTDLHFLSGRLPINPPTVLGHEFVGKITDIDGAAAQKNGLKIGDNVVVYIAVACGECILCKSGDVSNCVNMKVTNGGDINVSPYLYGGFAGVNFTPAENLIKIPGGIDPVTVASFACPGPTAIHAFNLAKRAGVDLKNIRSAVVQGLGPVGIFAAMYLKAAGVERVFAITGGKSEGRENAARAIGVENIFNLSEISAGEITATLQKENGGLGVDLAFEASGAPQAVAQGIDILRNRGVYLIPGQYSNSGSVEIQPQMITFKALHIIGASQYDKADIAEYLEFLRVNTRFHKIISGATSKYPLENINEAFIGAKAGENVKTLLVK